MTKLRLLCASALLALVGGLLVNAASPAAAAPLAQANLLANPGFEGGYSSASDTQVANGWAPWHENTDKGACPPCNYALRPKWSPETISAPLIQQGTTSQHVGNQYDPWHGGVFQTVAVPAGSKVRFTAFLRVRSSNEQYPDPSYSNFDSNAQVGIDRSGGGVWNSGVSWSGTINPHDTWQSVSIDGTAGGSGKVSVYIGVSWKGNSAAHLDAWFDNASLTVVGQNNTPTPGGPTAKPTVPPNPVITPFPTPTPGQDGRIVYIVKPGDSMWHIAAVAGLTVEQLKALNNLNTTVVSVGQQLLLGTVTAPATPIPTATLQGGGGETPAPTEAATTAAPATSTGDVCYILYEDVNGNGLRDAGEGPVAGGQFILSNTSNQPIESFTTTADATEGPHCSRDLAVGGYNIAATVPSGYNPTTNTNVPLSLEAGATVSLEFGAQKSAASGTETANGGSPSAAGGNTKLRTALFGAAGVVFLLLAAGLAGFLFISRRGT